MNKLFFNYLIVLLLSHFHVAFTQNDMPPCIKNNISYPVLGFHSRIGVTPIATSFLHCDPTIDYKIVLDLYGKMTDSIEIHSVFLEAARSYDLKTANGVLAEKIQVAAVIHGVTVWVILTEELHQEKYHTSNLT